MAATVVIYDTNASDLYFDSGVTTTSTASISNAGTATIRAYDTSANIQSGPQVEFYDTAAYFPATKLQWTGTAWALINYPMSFDSVTTTTSSVALLYASPGILVDSVTTTSGDVTFTSTVTPTPPPGGGGGGTTPPTPTDPTGVYLYSPPTWRNVQLIAGSLRYGIPTSTVVWRQGGVWYNAATAGMDNPVIADVDVDANSGLRLFFDRPTVVPGYLFDELTALDAADTSWSAGSLTQL